MPFFIIFELRIFVNNLMIDHIASNEKAETYVEADIVSTDQHHYNILCLTFQS